MDLAKAKNIIIGLLLAFNLFMLFINVPHFNTGRVSKETIENTELILKSRGVTLETKIPTASKKARRLVYGIDKLDKMQIVRKFFGEVYTATEVEGIETKYEFDEKVLSFTGSGTFVFTDKSPDNRVESDAAGSVKADSARKAAGEFLKEHDLLSRRYVVDSLHRELDGGMSVTFIEKYDDFLVFDNYCIVTVTLEGITRVEYSWLQVKGFSEEIPAETTDAYQVLLAHYKNDSDDVITDIDIGYKYYMYDDMEGMETLELVPVWRVKLKGERTPNYLSLHGSGSEG